MCEWSATEPTRLHLLLTKVLGAMENDVPISSITLTADEFEQCGGSPHKDRSIVYDFKRQVVHGLTFLTEWIGNGKLPGKLAQEIKQSNRIMTHYHGPKWSSATPVPDDDVDGPDSDEEEADGEEEEADGEEAADGDDPLAQSLLDDADDHDDDDDDDAEYQPGEAEEEDDAEEEADGEEEEDGEEGEGDECDDDAEEEAAVASKIGASKKAVSPLKKVPQAVKKPVPKAKKAASKAKEPSSPKLKAATPSAKPSPLSGNKRKEADSSDILAKAKSILAGSPASKKVRSPFS